MQPTSKRVVIIGGGIAGLSLALALKRLNAKAAKLRSGVHYDTLVIEANSSPSEDGMHIVLWRWALEALIGDLQVGGGLSRMAAPIVGCSALDPLDIQVPLNQFPPPASRLAASAIDSELPPLVSIRRCDLIRLLMLALADPEMLSDVNVNVDGSKYLPQSANNSGLVEPLHQDELEADLAEGKWFERQDFASLLGRNNFVTGERIKLYYVHPETGKVTVEFRSGRTEVCDMLVGADGTNSSVRKLMYLNVTKQRSLLPPISPTSSTPSNAAGGSHPRPAEYSGAAVFCGVTRLHVPPTDAPDTLEASKKPIEDLRRFDVQEFVPDGRSVTIHGTVKGGWFGCTNLGNGLLGWRLIVPQEEKGGIAAGFAAMKNRELMNEAIKTNPTTGSNIMSMMGGPNSLVDQGVQRNLTRLNTDETSAEDKWNSSTSVTRKPGKLRMADTTPSIDDEDDAGEGTSKVEQGGDDDDDESSSARKSRRGRRSIDMSALQSALKPNNNVPPRLFSASELDNRPKSSPSRATFVPSSLFAAPNPLTGAEIRGLALKYAEPENFPHPIYAIIARTDPYLTTLQDTTDLADNPLETFTLPNPLGAGFPNPPNLHRGRVMLIGDAAHPVTVNANGSLAPGLAVTDAVTLAKLVAKYTDPRWVDRGEDEILTPDGSFNDGFDKFMAAAATAGVPAGGGGGGGGEDDDDDDVVDPKIRHERTVFERIAQEFDRERCGLAAEVMKEARSESGRFNGPLGAKALINNSVVKSLWRMGKGVVKNATSSGNSGKETVNEETETYVSLMKRGAVKEGLPSLSV